MSVKSAARASRNPFVGTHTRRLVQETSKAVDVFFARSSIKHEKRGKNLFDYAFRFHNLGVGRRFQHEAWRAIEKDPSNPQNYWTVTRIVEATRHPYRRLGEAWGVLTWNGKPWHNGEERRINGAAVRKWVLIDEQRSDADLLTPPVIDIAAVSPSKSEDAAADA